MRERWRRRRGGGERFLLLPQHEFLKVFTLGGCGFFGRNYF
jgi:hypothetical protein